MVKTLSSKALKHRVNARIFVYVLLAMCSLLAIDTAKLASASEIEDFSGHGIIFEDFDDDDYEFSSLQNRSHFRHLEEVMSAEEAKYERATHV